MWRTRFAVEVAAHAKPAGKPSLGGQNKVSIGLRGRAPMLFECLDGLHLTFDARQVAGRQVYLARVLERDALFRIALADHRKMHAARFSAGFDDAQLVCGDWRVKRQTDDRNPLAMVSGNQNRLFAEPRARLRNAGRERPERNQRDTSRHVGGPGQRGCCRSRQHLHQDDQRSEQRRV